MTVRYRSGVALFRRASDDAPAPKARVLIPSPTSAAVRAESMPTVFACVGLIAQTAGQARIVTERAGTPADTPEWLRRPETLNGGIRPRDLLTAAAVSMATRGLAAFDAAPVGALSWRLVPIDPVRVSAGFTDQTRRRTWSVDGIARPLVDPDRRRGGLLVVPFLLLPDRAEPVGPLQAARALVAGYADTETYASRLFRSGAGTGPRLEADADIPETTATRWRDYWMEQHADPADPRIPVLGAGLRVATDLIDPGTAAWIDARQYNAQEIARLFRVPAHRLGLPSGDSMTYATARDEDAAFMRHTMAGYLDPLADALTALLPPGRNATEDQRVAFDWSRLLAPTPADQVAYLSAAIGAGLLTVDEARAQMGMGPAALTTTETTAADAGSVPA